MAFVSTLAQQPLHTLGTTGKRVASWLASGRHVAPRILEAQTPRADTNRPNCKEPFQRSLRDRPPDA
jgi:hypothetical protein